MTGNHRVISTDRWNIHSIEVVEVPGSIDMAADEEKQEEVQEGCSLLMLLEIEDMFSCSHIYIFRVLIFSMCINLSRKRFNWKYLIKGFSGLGEIFRKTRSFTT